MCERPTVKTKVPIASTIGQDRVGKPDVNENASWNCRLADYRKPDNWRSSVELTVTIMPFIILWTVTSIVSQWSYWASLIFAIPAAGFLVRLFMIQHDCGHGSMFSSRAANDWIGRCLAVLTLTPYDYWRQSHAHHHVMTIGANLMPIIMRAQAILIDVASVTSRPLR
jgi:acyl-lipid omega-6 desaturase (Delta-12 desaturase)